MAFKVQRGGTEGVIIGYWIIIASSPGGSWQEGKKVTTEGAAWGSGTEDAEGSVEAEVLMSLMFLTSWISCVLGLSNCLISWSVFSV